MSTLQKPRLLTFEEYLELEHQHEFKHEFVAGQMYAMAGASDVHNQISGNAYLQLRSASRGSPCRTFIADIKVRVQASDACYYPDVTVICEQDDDDPYVKASPCVIVEVLSKSTQNTDRREKLAAYRQLPSLRYYLMASSLERKVEYYFRNADGAWEGDYLLDGQTLEIRCDDYQANLDLDGLYEDVELAA